jgi:ABC-type bacteriocin/lantibiotic exporter with double-glycine peptidase domain
MLIAGYIAYTSIGMTAAGWLMGLAGNLGEVRVHMASAERLNQSVSGEVEGINIAPPLAMNGATAVSFKDVTFAYTEEGADVLQNVSFTIPAGAKVAIVGGSGSGKSTVLKLLLGLYEPKNGEITVLGNDARGASKYALREAFAYVPQDSFLFPYCIGENITGKKDLSPEELIKREKACRDAGIWDFINTLPGKFESVLSESAENISGGQRQRIAMARAFYKNAPVILFDEATSALDPSTEAEILKTLEQATKDKTVIMVAHRASAKAFCDTVITLERGRMA